jgi:hypothetical protein
MSHSPLNQVGQDMSLAQKVKPTVHREVHGKQLPTRIA